MPPERVRLKGAHLKAYVNYRTAAGEAVLVKVGISGTGIDGARRNLAAEIPGWDFDGVRRQAAAQWDRTLGRIAIETPDPHLRATFYTNLYQSSLAPTLFNDSDGTYRGMDRRNHAGGGFQNYTEMSLWDTFRSENPLLTLVQPARVDDIVHTMTAHYGELGRHALPVWPLWGNETDCMIGYHSVPIITDAYFKGFKGFNAEAAYRDMRDTAMQDRSGLADYKTLGLCRLPPRSAGDLLDLGVRLRRLLPRAHGPPPWAIRTTPGSSTGGRRTTGACSTAPAASCAGARATGRGGRLSPPTGWSTTSTPRRTPGSTPSRSSRTFPA